MRIVVTRLQARGPRGAVSVVRLTRQVLDQLRTQPGFLGGRLLLDRKGASWTVTGWADSTSLDRFRDLHAPVAARIDDVAIASASTAWVADALPTWQQVGRRWTAVPAPALGLRASLPGSVGVPQPS